MLGLHEVSKACDLNINNYCSTEEVRVQILDKETSPLSVKDVQRLLFH